jgi:hypothetical protein
MVEHQPTPLTLTPNSTPPDPPGNPPKTLPPSGTSERALDNPFRSDTPVSTKEANKNALGKAVSEARASFKYNPIEPLAFDENGLANLLSADAFNSAVNTVISSLDKGYTSSLYPLPLSPQEWARLSCKLLAAVGRGYRRTCELEKEPEVERAKAEAIDLTPIGPRYPTLFHRIAVTASDIETHVSTDQEGWRDWYVALKRSFEQKAAKSAAMEVEEKWRSLKADEIEKRAAAQEASISEAARNRNARYFFTAAKELGLSFAPQNPPAPAPTPAPAPDLFSTPTTGKKRTVSGSVPARGPDTPIPPLRISLPRAAKRAPSPAATPRGRNPVPVTPRNARADPSPTPQPRKTPPSAELRDNATPRQTRPSNRQEEPGIASTLQLILARLEALERSANRTTMGPPASRHPPAEKPPATQDGIVRTNVPNEGFTLVDRTKQSKKKGKGKALPDKVPAQPAQINITPASYAHVAAVAADTRQPLATSKASNGLPGVTEVTVLRSGGHSDPQVEQGIKMRAADAIVREVRLSMAKAVAKPIPLKAGRWSINPRSRGNFVYSFDGRIPFDIITSYERMLLAPFHGSGQLRPSLGWTRLLAHGVPTMDIGDQIFGPEELLREVRTMPGLKKAHLAMEPRWLKPVESIGSWYSTITFAVSDPDSTIINILTKERTALFGKEVKIRKWIDKPALVQCSRCHALGHIKSSRVCPLARNSVKCFICGGAHESENHGSKCPRNHEAAGVCDCKNYRCLNCQQIGHHCRDLGCPAREGYRPRHPRKARKGKNKGKEKDTETSDDAETRRLHERFGFMPSLDEPDLEEFDGDDILEYSPADYDADPWQTPNAAVSSAPTASGSGLQPAPAPSNIMEVDSPAAPSLPQTSEQANPPSHEYSPSRQFGATNRTMT